MEINKPTKTTYFICRDKDFIIKAYGQVEPNQVMTTGQLNVVTYVRRYAWVNKLEAAGITIKEL